MPITLPHPEALNALAIRRLVLISPYVEATNQKELRYMTEAGFERDPQLGLGLPCKRRIAVTPEEWLDITCDNSRPEAEGTSAHAQSRPRSGGEPPQFNQALWACLWAARRRSRGWGACARRGEDMPPTSRHPAAEAR